MTHTHSLALEDIPGHTWTPQPPRAKTADEIAHECRQEAVELRMQANRLIWVAHLLDGRDIGAETPE